MDEKESKEILKTLSLLLADSKAEVSKERKECAERFKMYLGKQEIKKRSKRRANTKTNLLFSQIETMKPILANTVPSVEITPVIKDNPAWDAIAKEMNRIHNRILERNKSKALYMDLVSNALFNGFACIKAIFNEELFGGFGDIQLLCPDSRTLYFEAGQEDFDWVNYIFEVQSVNQMTLLRRYPDKQKEIREMFDAIEKDPQHQAFFTKETSRDYQASAAGASAYTSSERYF